MKKHTYYTITNSLFEGTFINDWSELHEDTRLTSKDEALEYFSNAQKDWNKALEIHNANEVEIILEEVTLPYDEDGELDFSEQDSKEINRVSIFKK